MADCIERMLDPSTFEKALAEKPAEWQYWHVIRELHRLLATAKADLSLHERYVNDVFEVAHRHGWPRDVNREAVFLFFDKKIAQAKAEGAAEELEKAAKQIRIMPKLDKFTDAAFSSAADVVDRRAAAIRKAAAKEAK